MIFGDADRIGLGLQGKLDFNIVLLGAENDPDRGRVVRRALLLVEEVQVEVHLAGVLRLEGADLEVEGDEGLQEPVVEKRVDEILLAADGEPMLPPNEAEAVAQLEYERLERVDQTVLKLVP